VVAVVYASMEEMVREKGPSLKLGLSCPSYSNLDSIIWNAYTVDSASKARARVTGWRAEQAREK
jgi:hypothetical protein